MIPPSAVFVHSDESRWRSLRSLESIVASVANVRTIHLQPVVNASKATVQCLNFMRGMLCGSRVVGGVPLRLLCVNSAADVVAWLTDVSFQVGSGVAMSWAFVSKDGLSVKPFTQGFFM